MKQLIKRSLMGGIAYFVVWISSVLCFLSCHKEHYFIAIFIALFSCIIFFFLLFEYFTFKKLKL